MSYGRRMKMSEGLYIERPEGWDELPYKVNESMRNALDQYARFLVAVATERLKGEEKDGEEEN